MGPKIHVLILNWNGSKYLDKCINSIKENNYSNYDVTIIDNNSTDNSLEIIKKLDIPFISHARNYKYAKGYNEDYIRENKLRVGISTISRPSIENKEVE